MIIQNDASDSTSRAQITLTATAQHVTREYGVFRIFVAQNIVSMHEHIVLAMGTVADAHNVLCRIQSECMTGIVLNSADCDCPEQLHLALTAIHAEGCGLLLLLRQEGRGHGLTNKVRALANKNAGLDTFEAIELLGVSADARSYDDAVEILRLMGVRSVNLLTNNPDKVNALQEGNIQVQTVSRLNVPPTARTLRHLQAKKARGHDITL